MSQSLIDRISKGTVDAQTLAKELQVIQPDEVVKIMGHLRESLVTLAIEQDGVVRFDNSENNLQKQERDAQTLIATVDSFVQVSLARLRELELSNSLRPKQYPSAEEFRPQPPTR
ncbi:MAG: hypothetical protein PHZ00_05255 [Candidatus Peribacteraceae bacterium]|nr:hypothetical protein [Candidatus Peribacteraceae bacterium]